MCIWSKKNYRGDREVFEKKGATNVSKELNNEASSVKNRSGDVAFLMDAKNGSTDADYQCLFEPELPRSRRDRVRTTSPRASFARGPAIQQPVC